MLSGAALAGTLVDEREVAYHAIDAMLYALSLGFGSDPLDRRQLQYVYEDHLRILPTLPLVIGYPGIFMRDSKLGLDWSRMLHGEEMLELHHPLPGAGIVRDRTWIDAVVDRGTGHGAFVHTRKELHSENDGIPLATIRSTILCRADGGGGSAGQSPDALMPTPDRAPDLHEPQPTLARQALFYRVNGDANPLHADPAVAASAGFSRPLLHGRCTLGLALHAIVRACFDYDSSAVRTLSARFAAPFYPGETLMVSIWKQGNELRFAADCAERDVRVLSHGTLSTWQ